MEITGRDIADALVQKREQGNEVVNFSIAINDRYKPKGSSEYKEIVTYINCSYWLSSKVAHWIKKGAFESGADCAGLPNKRRGNNPCRAGF